MLKKDNLVLSTCENVRKIPNYAKRCVEILDEISKTTHEKTYSESAYRLVANGNWYNPRIIEVFLILIEKFIAETKEKQLKAEELNAEFEAIFS